MSGIGFIGLGIMGAAMASHPAEAGHEVIGHTHDPAAHARSVADASMAAREFTPGFRIDRHHKDMGIVTAAARRARLALPAAALITAARAQGLGSLDHSALPAAIEKLDGLGES